MMPHIPNGNPMLFDWTREECLGKLRSMELLAYHHIMKVLRSQGDLTKEKRKFIGDLQNLLRVGTDRHKAEVRRVVNDEEAYTIAYRLTGSESSQTAWAVEARRLIPLLPRAIPEVAYTAYATKMAQQYFKMNCSKPPPAETAKLTPKDDLGRTSDYTDSEDETEGMRFLDEEMVPENYCTKGSTYNKLTNSEKNTEKSSAPRKKSKKSQQPPPPPSTSPSETPAPIPPADDFRDKKKRKRSNSLETLVPPAVPLLTPQSPLGNDSVAMGFDRVEEERSRGKSNLSSLEHSVISNRQQEVRGENNSLVERKRVNRLINLSSTTNLRNTSSVKQHSTSVAPPQKVILISSSVASNDTPSHSPALQQSRPISVLKSGGIFRTTAIAPPATPSRIPQSGANNISNRSQSASSLHIYNQHQPSTGGYTPRIRSTTSSGSSIKMSSSTVYQRSVAMGGNSVRHTRPQIVMQQDSVLPKNQVYEHTSTVFAGSQSTSSTPVTNMQIRSNNILMSRNVVSNPRILNVPSNAPNSPMTGVIVASQQSAVSNSSIGPVYVVTTNAPNSAITVVTRTMAPQAGSIQSQPQRMVAMSAVSPLSLRTTAVHSGGVLRTGGLGSRGGGPIRSTSIIGSRGGVMSSGGSGSTLRGVNHTGTSNLRSNLSTRGITRGGVRSTVQTVRVSPGSVRSVSSSAGKSNVIVMHKGTPSSSATTNRHHTISMSRDLSTKITIGKGTTPKILSGGTGGAILRTTGGTSQSVLRASLTVPPQSPATSFHRISSVPTLKQQTVPVLSVIKDTKHQTTPSADSNVLPSTGEMTLKMKNRSQSLTEVTTKAPPEEGKTTPSIVPQENADPNSGKNSPSNMRSSPVDNTTPTPLDKTSPPEWVCLEESSSDPLPETGDITVTDAAGSELPEGQVQVIEEAMEVFCQGDKESARCLLLKAGITLLDSSPTASAVAESQSSSEEVSDSNTAPQTYSLVTSEESLQNESVEESVSESQEEFPNREEQDEDLGSSRIRVQGEPENIDAINPVSEFFFSSESTEESSKDVSEDTTDE